MSYLTSAENLALCLARRGGGFVSGELSAPFPLPQAHPAGRRAGHGRGNARAVEKIAARFRTSETEISALHRAGNANAAHRRSHAGNDAGAAPAGRIHAGGAAPDPDA